MDGVVCLVKMRYCIDRRYYPASKKKSKVRRATLVIVSMIFVVVSCIAAVYAFRYGAGALRRERASLQRSCVGSRRRRRR